MNSRNTYWASDPADPYLAEGIFRFAFAFRLVGCASAGLCSGGFPRNVIAILIACRCLIDVFLQGHDHAACCRLFDVDLRESRL